MLNNLFRRPLMILKALFGLEKPHEETALNIYGAIVAQARQPYFYSDMKVTDTVEGRYDMIIMHAFLLFHRLKHEDEGVRQLGQTVFDTMFKDLDQSLREMGVGDMGVGPRIKKMAASFYGRVKAYDKALEDDGNSILEQVIDRNVFNKSQVEPLVLSHLASYMRCNVQHLELLAIEDILAGKISYVNPETLS